MILSRALLLASTTVSASVITYENRSTDSGVNTSDYLASWNEQSSGINSSDLTEFTNLRTYELTNLRATGSYRHSLLSDVSGDIAG